MTKLFLLCYDFGYDGTQAVGIFNSIDECKAAAKGDKGDNEYVVYDFVLGQPNYCWQDPLVSFKRNECIGE